MNHFVPIAGDSFEWTIEFSFHIVNGECRLLIQFCFISAHTLQAMDEFIWNMDGWQSQRWIALSQFCRRRHHHLHVLAINKAHPIYKTPVNKRSIQLYMNAWLLGLCVDEDEEHERSPDCLIAVDFFLSLSSPPVSLFLLRKWNLC